MIEAEAAVSTDPGAGPPAAESDADRLPQRSERYYEAGQWRLMWWRFRKHKLAKVALIVLILLYLAAAFADFVAPYRVDQRFDDFSSAPPSRVRVIHDGSLELPFVYERTRELSQETFEFTYVEDKSETHQLRLFARGPEYEMFGLFHTDIHLFGTGDEAAPVFLFGTDELGRDLFSRIIHGARISLTIGFVGVFIAFVLGVILGAVSGYFGGTTDTVIQRVIEIVLALPTIPLWMAMSSALPRDWSVARTYFFITIVLALVGWAVLAREVRGKMLALRDEDFVTSARIAGAGRTRIMFVHLIPSFTSHLIVTLTLAIPAMILGETALSFLGLGMQAPAVSWGTLLQDAQNVVSITQYPWQLIPALFVILTVLMFNFLGDGLRDAADPYST